ncbi:MAG: ABC transporter substrate-binding protein [Thiolinea sp.]
MPRYLHWHLPGTDANFYPSRSSQRSCDHAPSRSSRRLPAIPTFLSAPLFLCTQSALAEADLNRGNGAEPQSLDPQISTGVSSSHIQRDLFEGLVAEDQDAKVIPGTASAWTVSDDGKTYTFTLRDDARWTNGDPVTAADFVYTYRRAVDPATGTSYSFLLYPIEMPRPLLPAKTAGYPGCQGAG